MTKDELLLAWQRAERQLKEVKEAEAILRKQVVTAFFGDETLREGTENFELGNGYKLKAVFKLNRKFKGGEEAVEGALQKIEKLGAEGQFIANRLVKWKPDLSVSEYKKLDDKFKKIIDEILISDDATPSVEIVEPKAK